MNSVPGIFAFVVAAAGFFYLVHGSRARALEGVEGQNQNARRIRLRRINGAMMIGLAMAFYTGFTFADQPGRQVAALVCMAAVVIGLPCIIFLAWVDLRLTRRLRERLKNARRPNQ